MADEVDPPECEFCGFTPRMPSYEWHHHGATPYGPQDAPGASAMILCAVCAMSHTVGTWLAGGSLVDHKAAMDRNWQAATILDAIAVSDFLAQRRAG